MPGGVGKALMAFVYCYFMHFFSLDRLWASLVWTWPVSFDNGPDQISRHFQASRPGVVG